MPAWITERFATAAHHPHPDRAVFCTAVDAATHITDLAAHGVDEFHLDTLNRSPLALAVVTEVESPLAITKTGQR